MTIYSFQIRYNGEYHGVVKCRADSPQEAFKRVREERPAYRHCQLVLFHSEPLEAE